MVLASLVELLNGREELQGARSGKTTLEGQNTCGCGGKELQSLRLLCRCNTNASSQTNQEAVRVAKQT
jgi:hypothetical protein